MDGGREGLYGGVAGGVLAVGPVGGLGVGEHQPLSGLGVRGHGCRALREGKGREGGRGYCGGGPLPEL